jgi:Fungal specific transcription factor domain
MPSRPPPTSMDHVINDEDVLLLQSVYSRMKFGVPASFFRQMAIEYGSAISCLALRHAILASAALELPVTQDNDRVFRHKDQAYRALIHKISTPSRISDADIIAASVMAWVAIAGAGGESEVSAHLQGSVKMWNAVAERSEGKSLSPVLTVFGPFTFDCVGYLGLLNSLTFSTKWQRGSLRKYTSFEQRIRYYKELRHTGGPSEEWQSVVVQAINITIGNLLAFLLSCIYGLALREAAKDFQRDGLECFLQDILEETSDTKFLRCFAELQWATDSAAESKELVVTFLWQSFRCIHLLVAILKEPTVMDGLRATETVSLAEELLLTYRTLGLPSEGPIQNFYRSHYFSQLLLVGSTLSEGNLSDRKLSSLITLTIGRLRLGHRKIRRSRFRCGESFNTFLGGCKLFNSH